MEVTWNRNLRSHVAAAIDLGLLLAVGVILYVATTGGGVYHVAHRSIRVTSVANPVLVAIALIALRRTLWSWRPRFAWSHTELVSLEAAVTASATRLRLWIDQAPRRRLALLIAAITIVSVALRCLNAVLHPGFMTGDDVELHEMTLASILSKDWPIWNLRSPLYPMLFLYPTQRLAFEAGVRDVEWLVLIGRLGVLGVATISIWLVYRIAREIGGPNTAFLATTLFALSRLHLWYGSSELPRPIAAVFILAAFLLISRCSARRAAIAGSLIGFGSVLRFGELAFVLPAVAQLIHEKRWKDTVAFALVGMSVGLSALAVADQFYWGEPFHSFQNAYSYTITQRQSSRGLQPAWFYVTSLSSWTNLVVFSLSLGSLATRDRRAALWGWLPILILSMLPHKEARYLIVAQPFVCVSAAFAADTLFRFWTNRQPIHTFAAWLVLALGTALVIELGDWHVRRSDGSVHLARELATRSGDSLAAQQLWRLGGRLYLSSLQTVTELPDDHSSAATDACHAGFHWLLLRDERMAPGILEQLRNCGYNPNLSGAPDYLVFEKVARAGGR